MTYAEAIAVRKRQLAGQPVDRDELAQANRAIAHGRAMNSAFGNAAPAPAVSPRLAPIAPPDVPCAALPRGCISVDEWLRTLPPSESYRTKRT